MIAIEGSHGSGKSTLVHGVSADLKSRGLLVGAHLETARENPIIEATRIHGHGEVDVFGQLSLFGEKLSQEARQARFNRLLVTDKTVMNIVGYARLLLERDADFERGLLGSMEALCAAYASSYDAVFFAHDHYPAGSRPDPFRPVDTVFQTDARRSILQVLQASGCRPIDIPVGLPIADRVSFVVEHSTTVGLLDAAS